MESYYCFTLFNFVHNYYEGSNCGCWLQVWRCRWGWHQGHLLCNKPLIPPCHYVWKRVKKFVSRLLENESIMLVADFSWHFNEACPIKFDNVKTTCIVKQAFDNLHPSSSIETKHANYNQFTRISIDNINQTCILCLLVFTWLRNPLNGGILRCSN